MAKNKYYLSINGETAHIQVIPAHSWLMRLKGLLGTVSLADNNSMWIKPCSSIHTMGMLYSIDILFLDKHNRVNKISEQVKPLRFRWGPKQTLSVIELSAGTVKNIGIHMGDTLVFQTQP